MFLTVNQRTQSPHRFEPIRLPDKSIVTMLMVSFDIVIPEPLQKRSPVRILESSLAAADA